MLTTRAMLGIDLRITAVKIVEIEKAASGYAVKKWGAAEVPADLLDKPAQLAVAKADLLRRLVGKNKIKTREAVVVVAGNLTVVKLFSLPEMPPAEAADAVKWKFAEELPFPIEEALISYYPLPKAAGAEKTDYLAACISRKLYQETDQLVKKAGLRLAGITVLPDAIHELYRAQISRPEEKITSIVYMGKRSTNISIFRRGAFEFNRELAIGGETITQAMSGLLVSPEGRVEVSPADAERIKVEHGVPVDLENFPHLEKIPLVQLQAMVRPALEKIQSEIARTFEYYKGLTGEGAVNKIILTGGSALTPHLKEFLSAGLGIPIETPEPLPGLNPRLSAATGAALTGAEPLNLVPEEVKFRWKALQQQLLAKPLVPAGALVGLLALVYLLFWYYDSNLNRELNKINKRLEDYKPQLTQLQIYQSIAQEKQRKAQTLKVYGEDRGLIPIVFRKISRIIPANITINSLNLTREEVRIFGSSFLQNEAPEASLSHFVLELSESGLFADVKLVEAVKNDEYNVQTFNFEILAKLNKK